MNTKSAIGFVVFDECGLKVLQNVLVVEAQCLLHCLQGG